MSFERAWVIAFDGIKWGNTDAVARQDWLRALQGTRRGWERCYRGTGSTVPMETVVAAWAAGCTPDEVELAEAA